MISDFLTLAFRNMLKEKMRSFMTLLGILISIATIVVLIGLSLGLQVAVEEQFAKLGTDKFYVQPRGQFGPPGSATAAELTSGDVDALKKVSGIKDVSGMLIGNVKIQFKDTLKFSMLAGVDPETFDIAMGSYDVEEGRKLKSSDGRSILLGNDYRHSDYLGEPIEVGRKVLINDIEFKVVGIVEKIGNSQDDRQIYIPLDEARTLLNISERVDFIVAQVDNPDQIAQIAERAEDKLMKYRDVDEDTTDFTILTPEELLGAFQNILSIITIFLSGIAAISLLVGGINIANAMFTSVLERTREIGVMKAIGAKNSDILSIFVIESGLLGLVGGILGVLAGIALGKIIEYVAVVQFGTNLLRVVFPSYLIIGSLLFAFLAGAVSGIWPANRATKIKTVEALRYE